MVKHLKKVCKTIISMLIKFVGFDHIFPESEMKSWKTFSALMILNLWFIFLIILSNWSGGGVCSYDRKDTSCPWSRESVLSVWENVPDSGQNRKNSVSVFRSL